MALYNWAFYIALSNAWHNFCLVHARVLKFHVWTSHTKIAGRIFFLSGLCPFPDLWQNMNEILLMHRLTFELCMLGFLNFTFGLLMQK